MTTMRRGFPLPPSDRARLAGLVQRHGLRVVLAAAGGLTRGALTGAMAGINVTAGTAALVRQAVARLERYDALPGGAKQIATGGRP